MTLTQSYPWYDSSWLAKYVRAKDIIRDKQPEKLPEFEDAIARLHTRSDFEVKAFPQVFDTATLERIAQIIKALPDVRYERHEVDGFGRLVVHNDPYITILQRRVVDLASEAAGEPLEPSYNFISLYSEMGVCPVHMDAPNAKWTLDVCIRQSEPWPIHLSQVVPWPEAADYGDDWEASIRRDPGLRWDSYSLEPGGAILFSGSSQWHYRDPQPDSKGEKQFCELVFFHFVPKGTKTLGEPHTWASQFGVPELL
jgi:hypothetical protein